MFGFMEPIVQDIMNLIQKYLNIMESLKEVEK